MTATTTPPSARDIWQEFHWAFFLNVQGLILCMKRLEQALDSTDLKAGETELNSASILMRASAAAMALAGSFPKSDYDDLVRPSMMQPNVASDNFSGLMSWEHGVLVNIWRDLRPRFASLPRELDEAHQRFSNAYNDMAAGHVHVCAKFVDNGGSSLRYDNRDALNALEKYGRARLASINPNKTHAVGAQNSCPVT